MRASSRIPDLGRAAGPALALPLAIILTAALSLPEPSAAKSGTRTGSPLDHGAGRAWRAAAPLAEALSAAPASAPLPPPPAAPEAAAVGSISIGSPSNGRLENAARLEPKGAGYRSIRVGRGRFFATDELVAGLAWIGRGLQGAGPGSPPLAVGDLSAASGGKITNHASHQNGRDVDLVFLWTDAAGKPIPAEEFVKFDAAGKGSYEGREVRFDAAGNWRLVSLLLSSPDFGARVTKVFIADRLERLLLVHARAARADPKLIERASGLMSQPGDSSPHDDHFHVRIACTPQDRASGCRDAAGLGDSEDED